MSLVVLRSVIAAQSKIIIVSRSLQGQNDDSETSNHPLSCSTSPVQRSWYVVTLCIVTLLQAQCMCIIMTCVCVIRLGSV